MAKFTATELLSVSYKARSWDLKALAQRMCIIYNIDYKIHGDDIEKEITEVLRSYFRKPLNYYYDPHMGNYIIPIEEYDSEMDAEVKGFLKEHRDYFLMYLSIADGYEEDYWCVTNWLE